MQRAHPAHGDAGAVRALPPEDGARQRVRRDLDREAGARQLVPPPMFPFEFGGYRMRRLLGRGGMGAVYEAEDTSSRRRVALKVLGHSLDSPDTRKRFLREGRLAASINHPNSVYVYGTEEIDEHAGHHDGTRARRHAARAGEDRRPDAHR